MVMVLARLEGSPSTLEGLQAGSVYTQDQVSRALNTLLFLSLVRSQGGGVYELCDRREGFSSVLLSERERDVAREALAATAPGWGDDRDVLEAVIAKLEALPD
jgi:hypothetical protein